MKTSENNTCIDCGHYFRHYIRCGSRFRPIALGHCIYPRVKPRDCDTPACQHFTPRKRR